VLGVARLSAAFALVEDAVLPELLTAQLHLLLEESDLALDVVVLVLGGRLYKRWLADRA